MFLALKITQAVLKYNDIRWTIVWKDNSVQGGYSSSSCTQRLERKCRGFSILDMCTIESLFKKNNVTCRRLHVHIKICSFCLQSQAGKTSIQNAHIKTPFMVFPETLCLLDSIDHGKLKSVRASFFFSSSSRACHSLIHCISKYYRQVTKSHCVSFPTGCAVSYIYPHFIFFKLLFL